MNNYQYKNIVFSPEMSELKSVLDSIILKRKKTHTMFYVQGSPDCGNTHLIRSLYNELLCKRPRARIHIYTGNELHEIISDNSSSYKTRLLLKKITNSDYLLIEDSDSIFTEENKAIIKELLLTRLKSQKITYITGLATLEKHLEILKDIPESRIKYLTVHPYSNEEKLKAIGTKSRQIGITLTDIERKILFNNFYVRNNDALLNSILFKIKAITELTGKKKTITEEYLSNEISDCSY